jgi:hypothetical protein
LLLTLALLLFLWLPPLQLYGEALWRVLRHEPARLIEALPLQPFNAFYSSTRLVVCLERGRLPFFLAFRSVQPCCTWATAMAQSVHDPLHLAISSAADAGRQFVARNHAHAAGTFDGFSGRDNGPRHCRRFSVASLVWRFVFSRLSRCGCAPP